MDELFGMLIPLLLGGAGIGDILRSIGGSGRGASSYDGLSNMMSMSMFRANMAFPARQSQESINQAIESRLAGVGFNPYTGNGQAAAAFLGSIYHIAPQEIGGFLGIPDSRQFFAGTANGASAVMSALNGTVTDIFNPYSVMASQKRAMEIAKVSYDAAIRPDGSYDESYGHGLSVAELGVTTQRLLSSRMAYVDSETGEPLDYENDTDKFKENLKKLGSEFNRAVSMMSKVTGDVGKAVEALDRMSGGNALGGTAESARKVAERANRMATAIRVTSAMAGMDPRETYMRIEGMTSQMAAGMGISPDDANASGFSESMRTVSYMAQMSYNSWAAMNQGATTQQKAAAMLAANGRAQAFMKENGSAYAAAVSYNADKFTKEEMDQIVGDLRSGRPENSLQMVKERIGPELFDKFMTDPAFKVAAMNGAYQKNPELLSRVMGAGMEGNLEQAERRGLQLMTNMTLRGLEDRLYTSTGRGGFASERDEAALNALKQTANDELGISYKAMEDWSIETAREVLREGGKYDEQDEIRAKLETARSQLAEGSENVMSANEEKAALERLRDAVHARLGSSLTSEGADKIFVKIANSDLDGAMKSLSLTVGNKADREAMKREIYGGKMSRQEAKRELAGLEKLEKAASGDFTDAERMDAYEVAYKKQKLADTGSIAGMVATSAYADVDMKKAFDSFTERVTGLAKEGAISLEDPNTLDKEYGEATNRIVSGVIGSSLGGLEGEELDRLKKDVSTYALDLMQSGEAKTFDEAFRTALGKRRNAKGLGESGQKTIDKLIQDSKDQTTETGKALSGESFFATTKSVIEENEARIDQASIAEMRNLSEGKFGKLKGRKAFVRFVDLAKKLGISDVSDEELGRIREEGLKEIGENEDPEVAKKQISNALGKIQKQGRKKFTMAPFSAKGAADANVLIAAMKYREMGGDVAESGMFSEEIVNAVSKLDDTMAAKQNAVANAWNAGGNSFATQAVEGVEKRMTALNEILSKEKISKKDIQTYAAGRADAALKEKIEGAVENESDRTLLKTIGKKDTKIGERKAIDVLYDGASGIENAKKGEKGKKYGADVLDIARKSGRGEGQAYELMTMIGDFIRKASVFFANPGKAIPVIIQQA